MSHVVFPVNCFYLTGRMSCFGSIACINIYFPALLLISEWILNGKKKNVKGEKEKKRGIVGNK